MTGERIDPGEPLIEDGAHRLRRVAPLDRDRLLAWRNQPHIRAASNNSDPIDAETHAAWFERVLHRKDGVWAVYERDGAPFGHVNAVAGEVGWRWSFYIGEADAPRGSGAAMLGLMLRHLTARGDVRWVLAETLAGNAASERLHQKLGFVRVGGDAARSEWRLWISSGAGRDGVRPNGDEGSGL